MTIVAIMQNMWFKDPARMLRMLETTFKGDREKFIKTFLFWSCRTGKNLRAAFGEALCDSIIWEEASTEIGGQASSSFPPDPQHIARVLDKHKPDVVIPFGKTAHAGLLASVQVGILGKQSFTVIVAPHPAARQPDVMARLREIGARLRKAEVPA